MNEKFEHSMLMGIIFLVIVAIFVWAAFIRKPSRRHHSHRPRDPRPHSNTEFLKARKRRKRRRKDKLPMNPTLAQTRGLPPVRDDHRSSGDHYQS